MSTTGSGSTGPLPVPLPGTNAGATRAMISRSANVIHVIKQKRFSVMSALETRSAVLESRRWDELEPLGFAPAESVTAITCVELRVPCGSPSPIGEGAVGKVDLNRMLVKNPLATFLVRCTGTEKGLRRGGLGLLCGFIRQGGGNGLFIQNGSGRRFDDAGFGFNEAEFPLDTDGKLRVGVGIVFADVLDDGIVIEIIQNRIEDFAVGSGGADNLDGGDIRSTGVGLAVVDALLLLDKTVIAFHFGVDLVEDIAAGGVKLRGVADDFIHSLVDFITPGDGGGYRF